MSYASNLMDLWIQTTYSFWIEMHCWSTCWTYALWKVHMLEPPRYAAESNGTAYRHDVCYLFL